MSLNDFNNYKSSLSQRLDEKVEDWLAFEYFCAEEIIPRLNPEYIYPETEEMLTKRSGDGGVDIAYENIIAQCKYSDITRKDNVDEIAPKLLRYLSDKFFSNSDDKKTIHVYVFCKTINPTCKKLLTTEMERTNCRGYALELKTFEFKEIIKIYSESKTNESIDLTISTFHKNKNPGVSSEEKGGGLSNLYQGEHFGDKTEAAMASIAADNLMEALKVWASNDIYKLKISYRSLFADNIRSYIDKKNNTNRGIISTIENEPEKFFLRNNGIVILCNKYSSCFMSADGKRIKNRIDLSRFQTTGQNNNLNYTLMAENDIFHAIEIIGAQVINGAQTVGTIIRFYLDNLKNEKKRNNLNKVRIPVKLISGVEDKITKHEIIKFHNTQTNVKVTDFHSNNTLQKDIHARLLNYDLYYEIRRGEPYKVKPSQKISPNDLSSIILWSNAKKMCPSLTKNQSDDYVKYFLTNLNYRIISETSNTLFKNHYNDIFEEKEGNNSWSEEYTKIIAQFCRASLEIKSSKLGKGFFGNKSSLMGTNQLILLFYSFYYFYIMTEYNKDDISDAISISSTLFKDCVAAQLKEFMEDYEKTSKGNSIKKFISVSLKNSVSLTESALGVALIDTLRRIKRVMQSHILTPHS